VADTTATSNIRPHILTEVRVTAVTVRRVVLLARPAAAVVSGHARGLGQGVTAEAEAAHPPEEIAEMVNNTTAAAGRIGGERTETEITTATAEIGTVTETETGITAIGTEIAVNGHTRRLRSEASTGTVTAIVIDAANAIVVVKVTTMTSTGTAGTVAARSSQETTKSPKRKGRDQLPHRLPSLTLLQVRNPRHAEATGAVGARSSSNATRTETSAGSGAMQTMKAAGRREAATGQADGMGIMSGPKGIATGTETGSGIAIEIGTGTGIVTVTVTEIATATARGVVARTGGKEGQSGKGTEIEIGTAIETGRGTETATASTATAAAERIRVVKTPTHPQMARRVPLTAKA